MTTVGSGCCVASSAFASTSGTCTTAGAGSPAGLPSTRDETVAAAIKVADAEGSEAISMRRIAGGR